jgi:hypothetical protein
VSIRIWCGKHHCAEPKFGKNRRSSYSKFSHKNVHKKSNLVKEKGWSKKLDNCYQTLG